MSCNVHFLLLEFSNEYPSLYTHKRGHLQESSTPMFGEMCGHTWVLTHEGSRPLFKWIWEYIWIKPWATKPEKKKSNLVFVCLHNNHWLQTIQQQIVEQNWKPWTFLCDDDILFRCKVKSQRCTLVFIWNQHRICTENKTKTSLTPPLPFPLFTLFYELALQCLQVRKERTEDTVDSYCADRTRSVLWDC